MALNCISPGDFMVSIDLKDAYFSVPIFQPHRKYLRFLWNFKRYEFTYLPFGYSLAPRVFTKIFKPIIAYFRFLGFRVVIFIDDLILIASSYDECLQQLEILKSTLLEGDIGVCGIAVLVNFSCGISVIFILNCVIAVFSESAG